MYMYTEYLVPILPCATFYSTLIICTDSYRAAGEVTKQLQLQEELCPQAGRVVFLSRRQAHVKLYGNKRETETGPSEAQPDTEAHLQLLAS